jgi:hypothetical protein
VPVEILNLQKKNQETQIPLTLSGVELVEEVISPLHLTPILQKQTSRNRFLPNFSSAGGPS